MTNITAHEEGKAIQLGLNSEQVNFRDASMLVAKQSKCIDMLWFIYLRTLQKIITKIATNPNDPKTVFVLQSGI